MSTPLVSIIMPLYNKRPYVRRAVDSIINQSFTDWELIIVDDGSTDGSSDEIPSDSRIRLLKHENAGPAASRNRAVNISKGEYLTFIDADDYYYPHKLEREMELLEETNLAEWMVSAYDKEIDNQLHTFKFHYIDNNEVKSPQLLFQTIFKEMHISGWHINGICMKRSIFDELHGFNENMRWMEITDFQIRCALIQPKALIHTEPLFRVFDVKDSASKILPDRIEGMRLMCESLYKLSNDYPEFSRRLLMLSNEKCNSYVSASICNGERKAARKYLIDSYPFKRRIKWWKLMFGSLIPHTLIKSLMNTGETK